MNDNKYAVGKPTIQRALWGAEDSMATQSAMLTELMREVRALRSDKHLASHSNPAYVADESISPTIRGNCRDESHTVTSEIVGEKIFNEFICEGRSWRIITADQQHDFWLENRVGHRHIGTLLQSPRERFTPMYLDYTNGTKPKRLGIAVTRLSKEQKADCAIQLPVRNSLDWNDAVIDPQCDNELRQRYQRVRAELQDAYEVNDADAVRRLEPQLLILVKRFHADHDMNGNVRLFQKSHWTKSHGTVTNAITRAIAEISVLSKEIARQLDKRIYRKKGFSYWPDESLPPWKVSISGTSPYKR